MEHLLYNPPPRTFRAELRAAAKTGFDIASWPQHEQCYGACPPATPQIPWLGHDHAASSYYGNGGQPQPMLWAFRDLYGAEWDLERMFDAGDLRRANEALLRSPELSEEQVVHRFVAFVQAWLYFGLLEAICRKPVSTAYLVRQGQGDEAWVYSRNLPVVLELMGREMDGLETEFREARLREIRECVGDARRSLEAIRVGFSSLDAPEAFRRALGLIYLIEPALSALFEAISHWTESLLGTEIQVTDREGTFPKQHLERLISKGWCSFVIASADIALSASLLRYIDAVGFVATSQGHWGCTSVRCERNFIKRESYTQRHQPQKCRCKNIKPDLAVALEILDAGCIPVVLFDAVQNTIELGGVHPEDLKTDYLAFSHVWADGLGSCTEVGLPACQIRRLHRLANTHKTIHERGFWIDGLCVPRLEPYRGKAIELMKATYQNATGAIVLDEGLRQLSTRSSDMEVAWSLFASGWFGRLWTYQEGFLPPWVDLEVSDGLIDLSLLIRRLYYFSTVPKASPFPGLFTRDLLAILQKARPLASSLGERSKQKRIADLFNALTRRDSSRPGDQLLVMGLLLGINIRRLLELDGENRWRAFYLSLGQIQWTIVFDQRQKMLTSPFRWAPATWLSAGRDEWLHYDEDLAEITEDGLKISRTILVLSKVQATTGAPLVARAGPYLYEILLPTSEEAVPFQTFNAVIVRHFSDQLPQANLLSNRSVYMKVGIGLIHGSRQQCLQYDFNCGTELQLLGEDEAESINTDPLEGQWKHIPLCFT